MVYVAPGSTAANETMVTFTNAPAGGTIGDLKLCKLTSAPIYVGRSFSFRVNGGPLVSTTANDAALRSVDLVVPHPRHAIRRAAW